MYEFPDGAKYEGEWKNDKYHGKGKYEFNNYTVEGEYVNGKLNGLGTEQHEDGTTYAGMWKDAQYHGQGVHTFPDGMRYEGEYKEG